MEFISVDSLAVNAISEELHRISAAAGSPVLWLAIDGSPQSLPEIDGLDWTEHRQEDVRLLHPEVDPAWWPKWYALHLDRASDCHVLKHSISWALTEVQPGHLRAGLGRRISGWLLLDGEVLNATQHWASTMIHRRAHPPSGTSLLRLHDPAVLWAVWRVLSSQQRLQWMGPVRNWFLIDPLAKLTSLDAPRSPGNARQSETPTPLSLAQWQDIENITALNHALQRWISTAGESARLKIDQRFQQGIQSLQRARSHGVRDPACLALFGELALTRHPQFDKHPDVQKLLSQHDPDQPLGGLLSDLTETDWLRIAAEQ